MSWCVESVYFGGEGKEWLLRKQCVIWVVYIIEKHILRGERCCLYNKDAVEMVQCKFYFLLPKQEEPTAEEEEPLKREEDPASSEQPSKRIEIIDIEWLFVCCVQTSRVEGIWEGQIEKIPVFLGIDRTTITLWIAFQDAYANCVPYFHGRCRRYWSRCAHGGWKSFTVS